MTERRPERDIGAPVVGFTPPPRPGPDVLSGAYVTLERLDPTHAAGLFAANRVDDAIWEFLPYGPFDTQAAYGAWLTDMVGRKDPYFYAIWPRDATGPQGVASFVRIAPEQGSIEVGAITYASALQGTRAATEAMLLMMRWAFEAGYRRYEWKCDARNLPSRRAAQRLGFSYEGVFRQASIVKGRNRDTAWFAIIDSEWPALEAAYARWLAPENFTAEGTQRTRLSALTAPIRVASDPAL